MMNGAAKRQAIRDRLATLEKHGRITPEIVLADAKKTTSPLHGEFEWDDAVAGHKYRLEQARELLRVEYQTTRREIAISGIAYVRDPDAAPGQQGYRSVASLRSERDKALAALRSEAGRASAYLDRVRSLAVALDLEGEVDKVVMEFMAFRRIHLNEVA